MAKRKSKVDAVSQSVKQQTASEIKMQVPVFAAAPDFKTIYTNFVNSGISPFDISMMLGEAVGPGQDGRPVVIQRAKVIMAPAEAKIVVMILTDAIEKYEKQFGRVVVAKELMPVPLTTAMPVSVEGV